MSLGVIRSGGLPKSTVGAAAFAGTGVVSGTPQGVLSAADDHGSNIGMLLCEAAGTRLAGAGTGAALGAGCDDRLNAELKSLLCRAVGEEAFGTIDEGAFGADEAGAGAGAVDAQPPKSSELNSSAGMFAAGC